jgi:hypothetical protein
MDVAAQVLARVSGCASPSRDWAVVLGKLNRDATQRYEFERDHANAQGILACNRR